MVALKDKYFKEMVTKLGKELGIKNHIRVPRLVKVVVNMGFGIADKDAVKAHVENLARITGQKPLTNKAKKSISNFKLREGMSIGAKVTLRGDRMYEFLERLINASLPRIRDFRGLPSNSFDGRGNYTMGIKEVEIFPEVDANSSYANQGLDITIVTSTEDDKEAFELLKMLGIPFAKK